MLNTVNVLAGLSIGAIVGIVIAAIFLVIIIFFLCLLRWYIRARNWFRQQKVKIQQAKSSIEITLEKNYDLLTLKAKTINAGANVEIEGLRDVIAMRQQHPHFDNIEDMNDFNKAMSKAQSAVNVVVEQYPNIKTSTLYMSLMNDQTECEEQLMAARRMFNAVTGEFNKKCVTWPYSFIARSLGFKEMSFFEGTEYKKDTPQLNYWTPNDNGAAVNAMMQGSPDDPKNFGKK